MRSACESGPRPGPALFYYLRRPTTDRRSGGVMKGKATRAMTTEATPVINTGQIDTAVLTEPRLIAETAVRPRVRAPGGPHVQGLPSTPRQPRPRRWWSHRGL